MPLLADNLTVGQMQDAENMHINPEFIHNQLIAGWDVVVAVAKPQSKPTDKLPNDTEFEVIGFLDASQFTHGRTVTQKGELGSNAVFTIITTGQKQMTFNRTLIFKNILKAFYQKHIDDLEPGDDLTNSKILIDLDNKLFNKPIHVMLIYFSEEEENQKVAAKIVLEYALIANVTQPIREGQRQTVESLSLVWEKTTEYDLG